MEYRLWSLMSKLDCYQHLSLTPIKSDRLRQYQADSCSLTEAEMNRQAAGHTDRLTDGETKREREVDR